jgi:hypothetical protein
VVIGGRGSGGLVVVLLRFWILEGQRWDAEVRLFCSIVSLTRGIAARGIAARGIAARGIAARGIAARGIAARGIAARGIAARGIAARGIAARGIAARGIAARGIAARGIGTRGIAAGLGGRCVIGFPVLLSGLVLVVDIALDELKVGHALSRG